MVLNLSKCFVKYYKHILAYLNIQHAYTNQLILYQANAAVKNRACSADIAQIIRFLASVSLVSEDFYFLWSASKT